MFGRENAHLKHQFYVCFDFARLLCQCVSILSQVFHLLVYKLHCFIQSELHIEPKTNTHIDSGCIWAEKQENYHVHK